MIKYNAITFLFLAFLNNGLFGSEFSNERKSTDSISSASSTSSVSSASKLKNRLQEAKKESEKQEDLIKKEECLANKRIEVCQSLNATFVQNKREKDRKKHQEDREKRKSFYK